METKIVDKNREFNPGDDLIVIKDHRTPGRNITFPIREGDKVTVESVFIEPTGQIHLNTGYSLPFDEDSLHSLDTGSQLGTF